MDYVTLTIAITGILLVCSCRPVQGLVVYVTLSLWYPYGIGTVGVGTIDFSAGRLVIIALFAKIFFSTSLVKNFKIVWLDKLVITLFAAEILAGITTTEAMKIIEYRSGDFFDMALPYFAVRLIVTSREKYILLLKAIVWSVGILALFGIFESVTGHNLLALGRSIGIAEKRMIYFHRAQTTFRHSIYYGIFSSMAGALCLGLMKLKGQKKPIYKVLCCLCFIGAFSSMSSGSMLAMVGAFAFLLFYRYRREWRSVIIFIVIMCGAVEIISNRHFYDVVDRFCFNSATAWYRGRLFEVVILEGGMKGHLIFGYGHADPGWGALIDGNRTDIVNHYLLELCRYGLVGFIPFVLLIIASIRSLFCNFWRLPKDADQWLLWCIAASIFSVLLSFNSVALFGMPMTALFMVFGFCVQVPKIVNKQTQIIPPTSEKQILLIH